MRRESILGDGVEEVKELWIGEPRQKISIGQKSVNSHNFLALTERLYKYTKILKIVGPVVNN
jgi:hypothetical protein